MIDSISLFKIRSVDSPRTPPPSRQRRQSSLPNMGRFVRERELNEEMLGMVELDTRELLWVDMVAIDSF